MDRYMIVIHPAKRTVMVNHDAEKQPELKTLQELVGGPIEVVPTYLEASWARENVDRIVLVVNEESRKILDKLPGSLREDGINLLYKWLTESRAKLLALAAEESEP